jgi:hypothetical protein
MLWMTAFLCRLSPVISGEELPGSLADTTTPHVTDKSFRCMTEMTRVGHFYVDNLDDCVPARDQANGLCSVPSPVIVTVTSSPGCSMPADRVSMRLGMSKIKSRVLAFWRSSPIRMPATHAIHENYAFAAMSRPAQSVSRG